jgi:NIMA (never in mitosis gene a)-related kinase 2
MASLSPPFTADNQLALALKIKQGTFQRIPSRYSEELMRTIRWMLKPEPKDRPNVEDLLNLPHVSMRLRERALKLLDREAELQRREKELEEKERQVEELERAVAEM